MSTGKYLNILKTNSPDLFKMARFTKGTHKCNVSVDARVVVLDSYVFSNVILICRLLHSNYVVKNDNIHYVLNYVFVKMVNTPKFSPPTLELNKVNLYLIHCFHSLLMISLNLSEIITLSLLFYMCER